MRVIYHATRGSTKKRRTMRVIHDALKEAVSSSSLPPQDCECVEIRAGRQRREPTGHV
jgi:hypothetical protein